MYGYLRWDKDFGHLVAKFSSHSLACHIGNTLHSEGGVDGVAWLKVIPDGLDDQWHELMVLSNKHWHKQITLHEQ